MNDWAKSKNGLSKSCCWCDRKFVNKKSDDCDWDIEIPKRHRTTATFCDSCFWNWEGNTQDEEWGGALIEDVKAKVPHKYLLPYLEVIYEWHKEGK